MRKLEEESSCSAWKPRFERSQTAYADEEAEGNTRGELGLESVEDEDKAWKTRDGVGQGELEDQTRGGGVEEIGLSPSTHKWEPF